MLSSETLIIVDVRASYACDAMLCDLMCDVRRIDPNQKCTNALFRPEREMRQLRKIAFKYSM